jgi:hypothetical protein
MFEQDDGENWDQSTQGAIAPMTRRDDLNYSMGLGHGKIIKEPGVPPHIKSLVNEYAQLWMYRCWAEFMKAPDWDYLKAHHSRPEGVL